MTNALKKLGLITGDEVKFHDDPSRKDIILPQGMYYDDAFETLERLYRANETVEQLEPEKFPYRPNDVYVAVAKVIQRIYGLTFSAGVSTFFGEEPPTFKSVPVSLTETVEVATGRIIIPELERAEIFIGTIHDRELGEVGAITATMKRKDRVYDVFCAGCYAGEGDCLCDDDDDDDDRPGLRVQDLEPGQWVIPADDDSRGQFPEDDPVEIVAVSDEDHDRERLVEFTRANGSRDYWYVRRSCRFEEAEAPDDEELAKARAEREAIRQAVEQRQRVDRAINELLNP